MIEDCLKSVSWASEIFVVDSFSTDKTKEIASKYTDKITEHQYTNSAEQKNWCLKNLPFEHEWLLLIDADERMLPDQIPEIENAIKTTDFVGFYMPRRNYFLGKEIRYCWAPGYELRLFRKEQGEWDGRRVHSELVLNGRIGYLKNKFDHFTRDTISLYISKLNRHTSWEADEIINRSGDALMNKSAIPRPLHKKAMRRIWHFLPFKPVFLFMYQYVLKRGFLDGYQGFLICVFQAFYVFLSNAKAWEIKNGRK
jgi:glycosyltransferase involved in cell wall biosynthesis